MQDLGELALGTAVGTDRLAQKRTPPSRNPLEGNHGKAGSNPARTQPPRSKIDFDTLSLKRIDQRLLDAALSHSSRRAAF